MACAAGPDVSESGLVLALDAADRYSFTLTSVEVLVVAGGGAGGGYGGNDGAGGGGAGGLIYNRNFAVTPGSALTVTVGAGGAGVGGATRGNNGENSVFGSLTAIGGGGGGSEGATEQRPGANGGSGGGAGGYGVKSGGNGTAGQGNRGGDCTAPGDGGGGGAGSAGENGLTGKGGLGLGFDISGSFVYYAGGGGASGDKRNARGGGGAIGGIGGGGKGQDATNSTPPENGSPNTGGGGGAAAGSNPTYGAGTTLTSGAGGSGIVIVRYPGPQRAIGGTVTTVAGHTIHTFTTVGSATFTPLVATNNSTILGLSDLSNRGNFGTTVNSPTYSSANGGSINFDGINEYMTSTISNNPTTQITLETWIYPERAPSTGTIRGAALSGDPNHYLGLLDSIDGGVTHSLHFALQTSTGRPGSQVGNIPRFAWSYIVGTYDGTRMKAYLNGTLVYDTALTGTISGSGNWTVGCYQPSPTDGTHNFDGLISNAKIYNRALTASEIQQNFNALRGRFGV